MKKAAPKISTRKRKAPRRRPPAKSHKPDTKADGILCPDCREPMTQVLTVTTFKWECRCLPGIHFCE
jgi:hypothetical protein